MLFAPYATTDAGCNIIDVMYNTIDVTYATIDSMNDTIDALYCTDTNHCLLQLMIGMLHWL